MCPSLGEEGASSRRNLGVKGEKRLTRQSRRAALTGCSLHCSLYSCPQATEPVEVLAPHERAVAVEVDANPELGAALRAPALL
jgi:hypothetical protein